MSGLGLGIGLSRAATAIIPWLGRLTHFSSPQTKAQGTPVALGPSRATGGYLGEVSASGDIVTRSGVARSEFRYTTWAADHEAVLAGVSGGSAIYTHALADIEHITLVYGDGSGRLGEVWVERGLLADTIHWTGDYAGDLRVVAIAAANPLCVWQGTQVLGEQAAAQDTMAVLMFDADPSGSGGELYAEHVSGLWRFRRTGAAQVNARMAILKLLEG